MKKHFKLLFITATELLSMTFSSCSKNNDFKMLFISDMKGKYTVTSPLKKGPFRTRVFDINN